MSDYGIKPEGPVIKRLDTIVDEIHSQLSLGWGFNTRLDPKSFLNVLLTGFSDQIAELWELGQEIYNSHSPSTAEGFSLDMVAQLGGAIRDGAAKTYYPMHCECIDGTEIPAGAMIASTTNPAVNFVCPYPTSVSRSAFNRAKVRVLTLQANSVYTVAIDGDLYSYTSNASPTTDAILNGLAVAITSNKYDVAMQGSLLRIEAIDIQSRHAMILSGNLTTETVIGIVNFASEQYGEIALPNGSITKIVTSVPGFLSCVNLAGYIAGRLQETDTEFRQSYAQKIFSRSLRMTESIESAILLNVQGVKSVKAYENDQDTVDSWGRPPHSVEVVVDGGSDAEIAVQILNSKAGGINTFGSTEVEVPERTGEPFIVRFNRPVYVYVWLRVNIWMSTTEEMPSNYIDVIKSIVLDAMKKVVSGKELVPQKFVSEIYKQVPGLVHIEIPAYYTEDVSQSPSIADYNVNVIPITPRQRAVTDDTRIEVVLVG